VRFCFEGIAMELEANIPIFMGVCESALVRGDGLLQDFYGVGELVLLPFLPQNLNGIYLLIGVPRTIIDKNISINFITRDKKNPKNSASMHLESIQSEPAIGKARIFGYSKHYSEVVTNMRSEGSKDKIELTRLLIPPNLIYKQIPIPCPPLFITEPTEIDVIAKAKEKEVKIGSFECKFVPTPPISEQERMAIMSRPGAINGLFYKMRCNKCNDKVLLHLLLDEKGRLPDKFKQSILLKTAPHEWKCRCGKTEIPLIYLKQGLHEMFRRTGTVDIQEKANIVPLYQRGAIASIINEYQKFIIEYATEEEAIQKFMENTPILWNFLAPRKIWKKPPIITKYNADFGILTRMNILYFIEIEKPATKLVKTGGGVHSELQVGLDQIRDWRIEVEKHREAVLDAIGLTQKGVHDIRYILIAGMASNTSSTGLEKIRRMSREGESIFCFDELASFLHSTETALLNI
jgi:hypothetical protein